MNACCNTAIGIGHSATLVAHGPDMASYQWQPSSSVACLNPICDSVKVTPTITTTYTITGTNSCSIPIEELITVVVGRREIPSVSNYDIVTVYPNPSSTSFTVDLPTKFSLMFVILPGAYYSLKWKNPAQ